ncbi:hypothetical protein F4808DRAFT_252234 [Astrocystis sublimbata]|nr:hypothetical protein F4808DRAFT_252234 [Astrocystis sublimbata]
MKQDGDDVEAQAQARLMSNKDAGNHDDNDAYSESRENFDYDYDQRNSTDDIYGRWVAPYVAPCHSSSRQLWRRLQSIPLPSWLPIRKLSQLSPRFLIIVFAVSFTVTVLLVNPYGPLGPSRTPEVAVEVVEVVEIPAVNTTRSGNGTHHEVDPDFCTTWPVDYEGEYDLDSIDRVDQVEHTNLAPEGGWSKPKGLKVIAMVFYGRKRYVDILDCYLQQNLASNGGYLDEVWFMAHTEDEDDLAWLDSLVKENQSYKIKGHDDCGKNDKEYGCLWKYATGDNTMYIKIDDDIIYIHHDAIPQLVHTRLAVPHAFAVSSQLVNSPVTGLEQFHHNAIYPFVPDPNRNPSHNASETWRLSELDFYPKRKFERLRNKNDDAVMYPKPPYRGHPFVLLSEDNFDLLHTSMGRYDQNPGGDNIAFSPIWKSWAMAAQQQYSLLYNLEKNQISRYFFGRPAPYPEGAKGPDLKKTIAAPKQDGKPLIGGEQIFDTQFRRYNLNFVAVWGADIKNNMPIDNDDEDAITRALPQKTGRPFIIDTRSIVGHFSFYTQSENIRQTDLLDRWRAFANEAVCKPENLKKPVDYRCPKFEEDYGKTDSFMADPATPTQTSNAIL